MLEQSLPESNMTCPLQTDNADVLLDYCSRTLDPERTAMLETHMKVCADCRTMSEAHKELWAALDLFDAEPISIDFDRKLYARIEASERIPLWERFWAPVQAYLQGQPAWKPMLSLGVASALLAGVFVVNTDVWKPDAPVKAPSGIEAKELEQVERTLEDMDMLGQMSGETAEVRKDAI